MGGDERRTGTASSHSAGSRIGGLVAALVNAALLWVVHRLLDWEWPRFLTEDFEDLLPIVSFSLVVAIGIGLSHVVVTDRRWHALGDLVEAPISVLVAIRTWQVFPFDFSSYAHDWSWLVRTVLVIVVVGSVAAGIGALTRLLAPPDPPRPDARPRSPLVDHPTRHHQHR